MTTTRSSTDVARTTRLMWWVGAVSVAVSAGAAVQLLVLPTRTEDFFAWTIAVTPSAAFIGIFYLASAVMGVLALRQPLWAPARAALVPVVIFVGLVLLVTLAHLETFHLFSGRLLARTAAWIWLVVYVVTPPAYLAAFWWQARSPGEDPPRTEPLWPRLRGTLGVLAGILGVVGVMLLLLPRTTGAIWPWTLSALTARMVGATLAGMALLAVAVVRVDDRPTGRIAAIGLTVCGAASVLVALGYSAGELRWSAPSTWVYLMLGTAVATAAAAAVITSTAADGRGGPDVRR